MKKVLLALVVLVGISTIASAQTKFGVTGGLSFATATAKTGTTSYSSSSRTTLNFGVIADFKGSDKFNVRSGLVYNGLGGKIGSDYLGGASSSSVTIALDYITIPLLARFKIAEGFHGYAGPQIGFLVSAKGKAEGQTVDVKDEFKGSAFSGLIGAEYNLNENFSLGANYNIGLSNLTKTSENGSKFTTGGFSINLGYTF